MRKDLFLYKDIRSKTLCKDFFSCLMVQTSETLVEFGEEENICCSVMKKCNIWLKDIFIHVCNVNPPSSAMYRKKLNLLSFNTKNFCKDVHLAHLKQSRYPEKKI